MYLVYPLSPWLTLALALPTGALLVRVFIVQHDCGHGSFFASRRANVAVGRLCSLITLTPFANWSRQHSPASRRLEQSRPQRRRRRHLFVLPHGAGISRAVTLAAPALPPAAPSAGRQPAAAAAGVPAALSRAVRYAARLGARALLGPSHQPRAARAVRHAGRAARLAGGAARPCAGDRGGVDAGRMAVLGAAPLRDRALVAAQRLELRRRGARGARHGSRLPAVLHWLTGNIGFHHVHHLDPRVPNYRLRAAHEAMQSLHPTPPLDLGRALAAPWLTLWDEATGRLVRFRDARSPRDEVPRQAARQRHTGLRRRDDRSGGLRSRRLHDAARRGGGVRRAAHAGSRPSTLLWPARPPAADLRRQGVPPPLQRQAVGFARRCRPRRRDGGPAAGQGMAALTAAPCGWRARPPSAYDVRDEIALLRRPQEMP